MKILLIDNYDSFTFNLYHYLSSLKTNVHVIRNDKINSKEILKKKYEKIVIKAGGGSIKFSRELKTFSENLKLRVVLAPGSLGVLPDDHENNMHVGGSKGSISGNYAMQNAELLISIGKGHIKPRQLLKLKPTSRLSFFSRYRRSNKNYKRN